MTVKEFCDTIGKNMPQVSMEFIVSLLIKQGDIKFQPIMESYVKYLEKMQEYNKCRLTECASLLHLKMDNVYIPGMDSRITHMLKCHSNMAISEDDLFGYDPEQAEKDFLELYNLN